MQNEADPQQAIPAPASVTKRAFAKRHSVSERTIDYWRERGMPCLLVSRRKILFPVTEADGWIRDRFLVAGGVKQRAGGAR